MKQTKLFLRVLCLSLALCMLCLAFAACNGEKNDGNPSNTTAVTTENGPATDEIGVIKPPSDIKLGRTIKILYTKDYESKIVGVEDHTDVVPKATYTRGEAVAEDLDVEIEWNGVSGVSWTTAPDVAKAVQTAIDAKDTRPDAMLLYNLYPYMLANKGLVQNLHNAKHIDTSMPWWPQIYISELTVNGNLYGISENSNHMTLSNLHGVFFNNELIESHKLAKSPYDMVADNTWTFSNMMELIKDTWSDKNNNGKKDADDFFGLVTATKAKIETWFFSMGYRYANVDHETGEVSLNMKDTAYMTAWLDEFNAAHKTNDFLIYDKSYTTAFLEERAILYASATSVVDTMIANQVEMDYGVVPMPKQNSEQESYISVVANTHVVWCVPIDVDLDESSLIVEWMAYEAYRKIAPVYYEQCMKLRYAPDERLAPMYDLIRATLAVDLCQTYTLAYTAGDPRTVLVSATDGGKTWTDAWSGIATNFTQQFDDILAALYATGVK